MTSAALQPEPIRPLLERARKKTAPRKVKLYEAFCAVLYLLRTGCQWRALPCDFPKWRTAHSCFQICSEVDDEGVNLLEQALKNQLGLLSQRDRRSAHAAPS